jgi:beta-glucosidase
MPRSVPAVLAGLTATLTIAATIGTPAQAAQPTALEPATPVYLDTGYSFAERAADLVSRMTLAEKVGQLHTNSAPAIARLGVQQYTYWSEAQHGVNRLGANSKKGSTTGGVHATSFPTNQATSMSWDPELIYQETTAISDEIRGMLDKSLWNVGQNNIGPDQNAYGNLTFWAPTVNMGRDPRWGRADEAFGEDPTLTGKLAGAYVDGYQGQTLDGKATTPYLKVAATAKHYELNNVEQTRHTGSSDTTEANIRNYYTPQFRSLVEDSHVAGLMTSYNAVNGTPAAVDTHAVNTVADRTWGFTGYTTSDCGAIYDVYAPSRHNWAPPGWTTDGVTWTETATGKTVSAAAGAQAWALRAGTQLNCKGDEYTLPNVEEAIRAGVLSEDVLDDALVRVFTVRMATGEFDPAAQVSWTGITKDQIESTAHQELARTVAANSLVLLKNDKVAGTDKPLLPADPATTGKVVIVGDLAGKVTLGGYSGEPTHQINAVQGITTAVQAANPAASVTFDDCGTSTTTTTAAVCTAQTLQDVATADLVVVFAGTDANTATEGTDRKTLALPGNYNSLIDQVKAAGNPRVALALQASGPVTIDAAQKDIPAVVFSSYNGQAQGSALADVLFGAQNPSGRLTSTWYRDDSQLPGIENYGLTPAQTGGLGRTYQYFTGSPSYPFGYGLSYTTFSYRHVTAGPRVATPDGNITVQTEVTNTGKVPGATVAQVYATTPHVAGLDLPVQRLVGFAKTKVLQPGETQRVTVRVQAADLAFYDEKSLKQVVYPGKYTFQVGPDSATVAGSVPVTLTGKIRPRVRYVTVQPDKVEFTAGQTLDLNATDPWIADDTLNPGAHPKAAGRIISAVNNDESFADLHHAHVTYRSSNPGVATVSRQGVVTTVAAGVATISVTVDGVTGSTPIVVEQPFGFEVPALIEAGDTLTATTTLPNPSGSPLTDVTLTLSAPDGWTVQADGPATFATIAAGATASTTWTLTAPSGPGTYDFVGTGSFTSSNGPGTVSLSRRIRAPYPTLQSAYNNAAITDDAAPTAGNMDGGGYTLSAQALAAATPSITPGGTVTSSGVTFTWPGTTPGTPDNVLVNGQAITIGGSGKTLGVIGLATGSASAGTATVTYTDGTTKAFTLAVSDWYSNSAAAGGAIVATLPYHNTAAGPRVRNVGLYSTSVAIDPAKTVKYLTLPDAQSAGTHIFAVALG